jgi:hypothetical protein
VIGDLAHVGGARASVDRFAAGVQQTVYVPAPGAGFAVLASGRAIAGGEASAASAETLAEAATPAARPVPAFLRDRRRLTFDAIM